MTEEVKVEFDNRRVLFVGRGNGAVCWYRCALPAMWMQADWAGVEGTPGDLYMETGIVKGETKLPVFDDYDIIVLQQPRGMAWMRKILALQERGKTVLYEIDDYLHGIRKMEDHDFRDSFTKKELKSFEICMQVCDGIICSTEYIARRYRAFNEKTWVCMNGIDAGRYKLTRPQRLTVNIGWAGATGHAKAFNPWAQQVARIMQEYDTACFVSIGQNYAEAFAEPFGRERCISTPFTSLETYPAAMTMFDIALGSAGKGSFFRGKSDLRWLEAAALGVPIIADPVVYPDIVHGETGLHAETPEEIYDCLDRLVGNEEARERIGQQARQYVLENRTMQQAAVQWGRVFNEVTRGVD